MSSTLAIVNSLARGSTEHAYSAAIFDSGSDAFDFSRTGASAAVHPGTTALGFTSNGIAAASSSQIGFDILVSAENAFGGNGNNTIVGDSRANVLHGGSGNDAMRGGGGSDHITTSSDTFVFAPDLFISADLGADFSEHVTIAINNAVAFAMTIGFTKAESNVTITIDVDPNQTFHLPSIHFSTVVTQDHFLLA